ncbi:hypothetical protein PSHT_01408 [Puccinia striiformis]|uniref:Uncharacterized protein n=1 Tax=Puccinia striiformis TaxID=27350 RepID=A0A2S4WKS8_9BASI|nr:hypothetical protein PSHT_01408 [Puccinia striiformis]
MAGTERRQTIPPQLSLTQQSEDLVVIFSSSLIPFPFLKGPSPPPHTFSSNSHDDQADIIFFQEWQLGNLKTTEKVNLDEEMEKIKTHLKSFNTPTQRETLDKIYGILDDKPHSLGKRRHPAEEPTQQNKKLMIQPTSTPFIPSRKSSVDITILPTKEELPSESKWTSEWIKYLPAWIQPYIEEIINVGVTVTVDFEWLLCLQRI